MMTKLDTLLKQIHDIVEDDQDFKGRYKFFLIKDLIEEFVKPESAKMEKTLKECHKCHKVKPILDEVNVCDSCGGKLINELSRYIGAGIIEKRKDTKTQTGHNMPFIAGKGKQGRTTGEFHMTIFFMEKGEIWAKVVEEHEKSSKCSILTNIKHRYGYNFKTKYDKLTKRLTIERIQ